MSLSGKFSVSANFLETLAQDLGQRAFDCRKSALISFLDGSGAGQANKIYADSLSVIQSVNTDIDLSGTLAGAFGNVVFTAIKGILISAGDANPASATVGGATNGIVAPFGAATHTQVLAPGGFYANVTPAAAGWGITAGTADLLRIATPANAGTYTFDVVVIGIG